jgi:NADH-quinone oxidoreductase subunit K
MGNVFTFEMKMIVMILEFLIVFIMCGIFLNRKNFIVLVMLFELGMIGFCVMFSLFSKFFNDGVGLLGVIILITLSAVDTAIVMSLLVSYYRHKGDVNILKTVDIKKIKKNKK